MYHALQMKIALPLKLLLNDYFKIFENFMAFHYHLPQIEASSLFQKSGKISIRFLVFLVIYLYLSTQK